ncbi:MAG: hypothetical protein LBI48_02160 [Burkholderiaceae bacterium]|jgi:hypothetical protein|nr:hypothetical protein [Burkholderiaceae bacterium]
MTYSVPDRIHHELLNWTAWCWLGPWPHPLPPTRCGSAEGDYRAPPEYDMELAGAPQPLRIRPNAPNAEKVQAVWKRLPEKPRLALKAEYPERHHSRTQAARKLRMGLYEYEYHLRYAVERVAKEFGNALRA